MGRKFVKNKEDFICEKCSFSVKGSGYTNHCPKCLYSKHVDINPGDREEVCGGLMQPIRFEGSTSSVSGNLMGDMRVIHKCLKCGRERANRLSIDDDMTKILEIQSNYSKNCL